MKGKFHAGYVALVGRPNVGKSSLLNRMIGQKLSITSDKPQTTRAQVLGILTTPEAQLAFMDTPGYQSRRGGLLNQSMNQAALQALEQADVIVWVVEAMRLDAEDRYILARLPTGKRRVVAVNKIDTLKRKADLLPFLRELSSLGEFDAIVPVSARTARQVPALIATLAPLLPVGEPLFAEDELTDRSERFLAAEILREKMFRYLGEEVPYSTGVEIEAFETVRGLRRIGCAILVKREGQKAIVIGQKGERLKKISTEARKDMESLFGGKVYLEVWVKVRSQWDEDRRMLQSMGYV